MASDWAAIQEQIRADALTADGCAIAALCAFGLMVASFAFPAGDIIRAVGPITGLGALFLFIFSLHFLRKARAAAEEVHRTIDQLAWEQWVSSLPAGTRWATRGAAAGNGKSSSPPPNRPGAKD